MTGHIVKFEKINVILHTLLKKHYILHPDYFSLFNKKETGASMSQRN